MRKLFFTLTCSVVLSNVLFAQMEEKIKEQMWGQAPAEFKATQVPEKWKNESAVLLAIERDLSYETTKAGYGESFTMHYRIKLLDKAAVNKFSELSFNNNSVKTNWFGKTLKYRILGIKVIKPNGNENILDMKDAVKDDAGSSKELKIPVPNLEPGDIIDYFAASKDDNSSSTTDAETLEMEYPVVKQTLRFKLYDQLDLDYKSFNEAPKFKKSTGEGCIIYTLEDEMREKSPPILWSYDYCSAPNFRYRVRKRTDPTDIEVTAMNNVRDFNLYGSWFNSDFLIDYMKGNFRKEKDPKKITYELYYLLRNPIYLKAYFNIPQGSPLQVSALPTDFFWLMEKSLRYYKISHDIMLAPSRSMGSYESLVNLSSCDYVIKVNTNPVIYITRPNAFSTPNEIAYMLQGTDAAVTYTIDNKDKVPTPSMENNLTATNVNLSLKEGDMTKLNVERSILAKGNAKNYHQGLIVTNYDYLKAYDLPKYQVESSRLMGHEIKEYNKEKVKFEQRATTDYNERDKRVKIEIESEMDVKISDCKVNLASIGMWDTDSGTAYKESFAVENITKKAGPNTIIELGKIIEKQVEIKDEQLKRTRDIYMAYPRLFTYELTFAIPDGYTMEGIDNFNMKVENATGGFVSVAKIDGKNLVIHAKKYYVKNYYPATDWDKITAFTQSANNFYNAKILLKKAS